MLKADACAASEAVSTLGEEDNLPGYEKDPNKAVFSLVGSTLRTTSVAIVRLKQFRNLLYSGLLLKKIKKKVFKFCVRNYYYIAISLSNFFKKRKSK